MRSLIALAAVLAAFAGATLNAPIASANECVVNAEGSGSYGSLSAGAELYLDFNYINQSDWTGNHNYNANRYYSNGSMSYTHFVYLGGGWEYGTSGNVYRQSSIQAGSLALTSWSIWQGQIC